MIDVIINGLVSTAILCLIGWACSYDISSHGYLNISIGDTSVFAIYTTLYFILYLSSVLFFFDESINTLYKFREIPIAAAIFVFFIIYFLLRLALHKVLFRKLINKQGSTYSVILAGLAIILFSSATLELFGVSRTEGLEVYGTGWRGYLTDTQATTLILFILCSIAVFAFQKSKYGKGLDLVTENRNLSRLLGLPMSKICLYGSLLSTLLLSCYTSLYFLNKNLTPTSGLEITVYGLVIAICSLKKKVWIFLSALFIGMLDSILTQYLLPEYWTEPTVILIFALIALSFKQVRNFHIIE
ncbi:MAG: hypothetical protein ABW158_06030 [Candidatus Thiodiazotropha sp. 6PDIVS]